jgi:hypothetical protein
MHFIFLSLLAVSLLMLTGLVLLVGIVLLADYFQSDYLGFVISVSDPIAHWLLIAYAVSTVCLLIVGLALVIGGGINAL